MNIQDICKLEERRISSAVSEVARYKIATEGGGIACRGEPGEWINCAYGVGQDGPVSVKGFRDIITYYSEAGIEPRLELNPFVGQETIDNCGEAGFKVGVFEIVLYRLIDPKETFAPILGFPEGVTVKVTDVSNEDEIRMHSAVAMSGFFEPKEEDFETWKRVLLHPKVKGVAAWCDGKIVGAGAAEIHSEIAALISLSVLPEYRGRGIQQALIAKRLELAQAAGVKVATVGSSPGAGTARNVMRMGFQVAYTKLIMRYTAPGLVGGPL